MKRFLFYLASILLFIFMSFSLYNTALKTDLLINFFGFEHLRSKLLLLWFCMTSIFLIVILVFSFESKFVSSKTLEKNYGHKLNSTQEFITLNSKELGAGSSSVSKTKFLSWQKVYAFRTTITDFLAIFWALIFAQIIRVDSADLFVEFPSFPNTISYLDLSLVLTIGWIISLLISGSVKTIYIGTGFDEYKRVIYASASWCGLVAIFMQLFKITPARSYFFSTFPIATIGIIILRILWRRWLVSKRTRTGFYCESVLVVGSKNSVVNVIKELVNSRDAGYDLLGVCMPENEKLPDDLIYLNLPIFNMEDPVITMRAVGANAIAIADSSSLTSEQIKEISWKLNEKEDLILSSNIMDISGSRVKHRPVAGLNLIHVEIPRINLFWKFIKRVFDVVVSIAGIIISIPIFFCVFVGMLVSKDGLPFFYSQERVGLEGKPFKIYKIRSMKRDSQDKLNDLLISQGTNTKPLFKVENDPRLTRTGKFLRTTSIDELPQFFNVLKGDMSIVGPRPQIQKEVDLYGKNEGRRLLAKPGLTGLWQIGGRSNLSWEESVRLDLYYVENWSFLNDMVILLNTPVTMFNKNGAK